MGQTASLTVAVEHRFASGFALSVGLDVSFAPGSILMLFGPSGAGKTTILRHLAGLDRPDSGTIRFDGDVWCDGTRWLAPQERRVGVVFQEPTLFPHLTVGQNIRYGVGGASERRRARGGPASDTVEEITELLGVADLTDRLPRELSGGQAHRVALARALAPGPRLLLLDEPFAALDAPTRLRLRRDVRKLLHRTGTPAVLVTHDRAEALAMGDEIAIVIDGRVRQAGPIADVFSRPTDAGVAASLGIEAVLPAHVLDASGGLLIVKVCDVVLEAADRDSIPAGSDVYACIRAEDVTLELQVAGQASARNHLPARVVAIAPDGPVDRVTIDCGFPLDALITRRSCEELRLAPGAHVIAAIKATSVHVMPRF